MKELTPIKSFADFKRNLTIGRKIHTTYHAAFAGRDENHKTIYKDEDKGIREVSIVQTNSFALKTEKKDKPGVFVDSWCAYPKASEAKINNDKSVSILERDCRDRTKPDNEQPLIPVLTYTFID